MSLLDNKTFSKELQQKMTKISTPSAEITREQGHLWILRLSHTRRDLISRSRVKYVKCKKRHRTPAIHQSAKATDAAHTATISRPKREKENLKVYTPIGPPSPAACEPQPILSGCAQASLAAADSLRATPTRAHNKKSYDWFSVGLRPIDAASPDRDILDTCGMRRIDPGRLSISRSG
ncbi:unnamed protein product [Colias eurytheme]|nr:unnamed protein product [Colias eurytheme]